MQKLETRIPPPLVMLLLGMLAYAIAHQAPGLAMDIPWRGYLVAALVGLGLAFDLLPALSFRRARTTVNPTKPASTTSLVTGGIYRYTRNPMYVGQALMLAGWALYLANAAALVVVPLFVLYITRFQIVPEERVLSARFPGAYAEFCQRTRRWL